MNSKERIKTIFSHKPPDKIGIFDFFDKLTLVNWKKQGFLTESDPAKFFDFDINFKVDNSIKNKFNFCSFEGPFQQLATKKGLQQGLIGLMREPRQAKEFFKNSIESIFKEYEALKAKGADFDGVWLYEDIAYDNGLYFSIEKYKDVLSSFHKQICEYFKEKGLFVVFHCDGNIETLIHPLVKLGFSGIHPLQEFSNPNLIQIKKDLKGAITFIGGIGLSHLKSVHQDVLDRIQELKEDNNYIFCFDGPIPQETEFETYKGFLEEIEKLLGVCK